MAGDALHHLSANTLARMITRRELSSRELLEHLVRRIEKLDVCVNAVVTLDIERARTWADRADTLTASGTSCGPFHGLPITVKDALAVAGLRSTGGAVELSDHVPTSDADVVASVRAAGAYPLGKTNVPRWSSDVQTYNSLFGTTNNPWDVTRVPGGSSGGAAAAVSLGFSPFELGTDIAGSLRIPAAFCGVVAHKPSFGLVPGGGYIDRIDYGWNVADINVHGPIARGVDDLELILDVIAEAGPDRAATMRHRLPPARHDRLDQYRVAVWPDAHACPASAETVAAVVCAGELMGQLGARVDVDVRPVVHADAAVRLGKRLVLSAIPPEDLDGVAALPSDHPWMASHQSWLAADIERARLREQWKRFFDDFDVLICPVVITSAFKHDQAGSVGDRCVMVDGVDRTHHDLLWWCILTGMVYLPATIVPVGMTADGLPLAVQIVGPYLEDRTPLAVARALRNVIGPLPLPNDPLPGSPPVVGHAHPSAADPGCEGIER